MVKPRAPKPYRVLIADLKGSDISAEIPHLFARADCTVDVYCPSGSWLLKGSYYAAWHRADANDEARYAQGLTALRDSGAYDWIVLTNDYALRVMNDYLPHDERSLEILPVSRLENRSVIGSKAALSELCQVHSLPTPPFVIYRESNDLARAVETVGFPLLLKVDRSGGGQGIFLCHDEASLRSAFAALPPEDTKQLVIQKYITGDNIAIEALYRDGRLLAYAHGIVRQNMKDEFGVSILREYLGAPEMESQLRAIGSALSFDGFCSYTLMRDAESGVNYLVEADLRTHAWFCLSRHADVDFSEAIAAYLSGTETLIRQQSIEGVHIPHSFRSIRRALSTGDIAELWRWCTNADGRWKFIPFHDPKLLASYAFMYALKMLAAPFKARTA